MKEYVVVLPLLIVALHISNISLIVTSRKLHKPKYVFLGNLSAGTAILLLLVVPKLFMDAESNYLDVLFKICATSSYLTTAAITMEKYIAVQYCLRYYAIVTWRRIKYSVVIIWVRDRP